MTQDQHPEDRELLEFIEGRLSSERASVVGDHLLSCNTCCQRLDRLQQRSETQPHSPIGEKQKEADREISPTTITRSRDPSGHPKKIDRYVIKRVLGSGGFGRVYLAYDPDMERSVAIKVPNTTEGSRFDVEAFVSEARHAARLNHDRIVKCYDVQRNGDAPFIVQEYIDASNLKQWCKSHSPDEKNVINLLIDIVAGIQHAHENGLYHRDLKPANILINQQQRASITDFGLALHASSQRIRDQAISGTLPYMSPEQTRAETHSLDGRSDIWSIGVIMYELLTQRRPFGGESSNSVFDSIQHEEPKRLREWKPGISPELERICLRCLEKRKSRRYIATELLEELHHWSRSSQEQESRVRRSRIGKTSESDTATSPHPDHTSVTIIPKGLRSFDEHDSEFFLRLLEGPFDRYGLPESIRFWKKRIEETSAERTFRVGVMYGPSGSGKSSLLKAGLLPQLSPRVDVVYIEASPTDTETRIASRISNRLIGRTSDETLADLFRELREHPQPGRKTLVAIDQFEQWLHAHDPLKASSLVDALRQCDGVNVQSILLVRDDFYSALSRLMQEIDVRLIEGENIAQVDRFTIKHAKTVLGLFGQAYDCVDLDEPTPNQVQFIDSAIGQLAQNNRVVGVRLSLFAYMMKDEDWTLETLRQIGGVQGLVSTFLEQAFSSAARRRYEPAVRAILEALMPDADTDIRGAMRTYEQLITAAGYNNRDSDFRNLVDILDTELRLITPTRFDVDDDSADDSATPTSEHGSYFQLTHDYLVPSLTDWLRGTRAGRAKQLLKELSSRWNHKRIRRNLPTIGEFVSICRFTKRAQWTPAEAKLMKTAAFRVFVSTCLTIAFFIFPITSVQVLRTLHGNKVDAAIEQLSTSGIDSLPSVADNVRPYLKDMEPTLRNWAKGTDVSSVLKSQLLLVSTDDRYIQPLVDRLLVADVADFKAIVHFLRSHSQTVSPQLRKIARDESASLAARFRASGAVGYLSEEVNENTDDWEVHRTISEALYRETDLPLSDQLIANEFTVDLSTRSPYFIWPFVSELPARSLRSLLDNHKKHAERNAKIARTRNLKLRPFPRAISAALASVATQDLTLVNEAWTGKLSRDPAVRLQAIKWLPKLQLDPACLLPMLGEETDADTLEAAILTLGQYRPESITPNVRSQAMPLLKKQFLNHPRTTVHSSAEWVLRKWDANWLAEASNRLPVGLKKDRQWFVTEHGLKFSIVKRGHYRTRTGEELPAPYRLRYDFAIATTELSNSQTTEFFRQHEIWEGDGTESGEDLVLPRLTDWYHAAHFCNWLSEREGLRAYYQPNIQGKFAAGMMASDPKTCNGYRLPTLDEWEAACRGQLMGYWAFGSDPTLLEDFAWIGSGAPQPSGQLMPFNGLFDMYGNVWEWTNTMMKPYGERIDIRKIDDTSDAALCGGGSYTEKFKTALPDYQSPIWVKGEQGFRIVRTIVD